eukprot:6479972-Amphidinium_carterae.1
MAKQRKDLELRAIQERKDLEEAMAASRVQSRQPHQPGEGVGSSSSHQPLPGPPAKPGPHVKELLKFIGEQTKIHLELDASSAISMGSRVGSGKARHVAVRYLWLQQLVADKTIKLVKVKGTQHPPDVGTKYLSKRGMVHAKMMLGLMEPESLAAFDYEVPDSVGVRGKLDRSSSMVASIGMASLMSGRELGRCAASFMFVMGAVAAPVRAAATAATEAAQELIITTTNTNYLTETVQSTDVESAADYNIPEGCQHTDRSIKCTRVERGESLRAGRHLCLLPTWSTIAQSTRVHSSDRCKIRSTPVWMGLTFSPTSWNDNCGWDASCQNTVMEWQLWMGNHCCQNSGMTTLDGKPILPKLWNDNSGWDATVAKK